MKQENIELGGKNTEEIDRLTRQLIQHITEAKNKAIPQTKYKTLPHPEDTVEMVNIRDEMHQQIEVMGCIRWQFQELHRLHQELKQLAKEKNDVKWTELVLSCEADRKIPSLFWQQVRRLRGNEQEEERGIKDEDNTIRLDLKEKEEALRRH